MIYGFFHILLLLIIFEVFYFDIAYKGSKSYYPCFKYTWVFLALVSAFKYGVGPDTPNYMKAYEMMPPVNELTLFDFALFRFQPLYTLTNSVCKFFTDNFVLVQICQSGLFFTSTYLMMKELKVRKFYVLAFIFLFFYFISGITAMRESFAMSFCFFSFKYYHERRWGMFYLFILIALGFHTGAIAFTILPFFHIFDVNRKRNMGYMVSLSLLFSLFAWNFLSDYDSSSETSGSIGRYLNADSAGLSIANIIKNILILFVLYRTVFFMKRKKGDIIMMAAFYVVLDLLSSALIPMIFRISSYFTLMFCYAMCLILGNKRMPVGYKIVVIVLFFYQPVARYINFYTNEIFIKGAGIDPYCSVFSDDKTYYTKLINEADALDYYKESGLDN